MRDSLDFHVIRAALVTSGRPWRDVEFHPAIGSTNARASEITRSYAAGPGGVDTHLWRIVLTDDQTGGRGRLGRSWEVPPRASVAVSAVVPAPEPAAIGWLPLLAGVALARAVESVTEAAGTPLRPRLKWPNDVLLADDEDRKVAGILCELVAVGGGPEGGRAVVVGAGVNVDQSRDELPVDTATSLRLAGAQVRREDLVIAYLDALADVIDGPGRGQRQEYRLRCATVGAEVRVDLPGGGAAEGTATGIDDSGALVVLTPGPGGGVERTFAAGDVVHVRRAGMIGP